MACLIYPTITKKLLNSEKSLTKTLVYQFDEEFNRAVKKITPTNHFIEYLLKKNPPMDHTVYFRSDS